MLVLSRKQDEEIVIGDGLVVITVVEIRGDKVRLGIAADRSIPVHRREIQEQRERRFERSRHANARIDFGDASQALGRPGG